MSKEKQISALMKRATGLMPEDTKNYVGVEIEFAAPYSRLKIVETLVDHGLFNYVSLGTDGSITGLICTCKKGLRCWCEPDFDLIRHDEADEDDRLKKTKLKYHLGWELRLLVPEEEYEDIVRKAIKCITEVEGKVNNSCGLHVHIDARSITSHETFEKKCKDWFNVQEAILKCTKKTRHKSKYCSLAPSVDGVMEGRHHWMGVHYVAKYRTFEIRFHHAILNAKKINNWIKLLLTIKQNGVKKKIRNKAELIEELKLTGDLKKYVETKVI